MKTVATITGNMAQAYGTERYIKHITGAFVFTDGIDQLRDDTDAHWLIDAIASHQRKEVFQIWELKVNLDKQSAVLTMKEDSNLPVLVRQTFSHTNFPLSEIKFYMIEGGYGTEENWTQCLVLMLPSEK